MNSWQKDFIQRNLPSLIEVTRCTEGLKAHLLSKGLFTLEDVDIITSEGRNHGETRAANKLYALLETRTEGFFGLMEALQETRQTGAWNIVRSGIQQKLCQIHVKLSGYTLPLNKLFTSWTNEDSVECLDSEDAMQEFITLLSNDIKILDIDKSFINLAPHSLYIPRFVSNRVILNTSAFKENCEDVFVFKGINKYDLVELVDPYPVRSSSDQLTLITCRHIYLESEEDWDDLRDIANTPLHLISKEGRKYFLERSMQITDTVLHHNSGSHRPTDAYKSEEEFAKDILASRGTKGICVCDIPGMGKTWYLESIAKRLQSISERTLVLFIQLSGFAKGLMELSGPPEDPLSYIIEAASSSKLVSYICKSQVKRSDLRMILILDGFDEIQDTHVGATTKLLKEAISVDNVQLLVSSRPRMQKHLEETFKVISYDILPFGREEQVSAIVGHWQLSIQDNEVQLKEYAQQCIRVVKDIQCENSKNILGIPLKCYLLAEIHSRRAQQIAKRRKQVKVAEEALVKSTYDLYEKFVESRISKVLTGADSANMIRIVLSFHMYQALQLLMPDRLPFSLHCYFCERHSKSKFIEEVALKVGIMSLDNWSQFVFLHRTFAEYFAGHFFAKFWQNLDQFDDQFVRSVAYYFVQNVLKTPVENFHNGFGELVFSSKFCEPIKKIIGFNNRTVLWFMNSRCHTEPKTVATLREASRPGTNPCQVNPDEEYNFTDFRTILKNQVFVILIACIEEQFRSILCLVLQISQVFFQPCELSSILSLPAPYRKLHKEGIWQIIRFNEKLPDMSEASVPLLLCRIALSGSPETAHEIFQIFSSLEDNYVLQFCDKFPLEFVSPVEVSIVTNNVDMFAYLLNKVKIPMERLILSCLISERKLSSTDVGKRADIFGRILARNKHKIWTVNTQDLVEYLESLPIQKLDFPKWIDFAFHHNLSLHELPRSNKAAILDTYLDEVGDVQMFELLHLLFGKETNLSAARDESDANVFPFKAEATLQSLHLTEAMATFALLPCHGPYFSFGTISNLETLKVLLQIHPNLKGRNPYKYNYIHLAAKKGSVDWIEYLVKAGHSVHEKDDNGETLIFHFDVKDISCVGVIDSLIENGANIYAVNNRQENIAHFHLKYGTCDLEGFTEFVGHTMERGYVQLWTMKNDEGTTAYQLLSREFGKSHPLVEAVLSKLNSTSFQGHD